MVQTVFQISEKSVSEDAYEEPDRSGGDDGGAGLLFGDWGGADEEEEVKEEKPKPKKDKPKPKPKKKEVEKDPEALEDEATNDDFTSFFSAIVTFEDTEVQLFGEKESLYPAQLLSTILF